MADKNISPAKVYNNLYRNEKNPVYGNKVEILNVEIEHYDEKRDFSDGIIEDVGEPFICSTINSFIAVGEAALNFAESLSDVALISMRRNDMELPGKPQSLDEYKKQYEEAVKIVGADFTGEAMSKVPEQINEKAWGAFKNDGLVYGTIEKFTGVLLSTTTGGAFSISPALFYGLNSMGTEFETTAQKFENIDNKNLKDYYINILGDMGIGTLEGFAFYITYGSEGYKKVFRTKVKGETPEKMMIQASKSTIKDLLNYVSGDLKIKEGESLGDVLIKNATINALTQLVWDKAKNMKITSKTKELIDAMFPKVSTEPLEYAKNNEVASIETVKKEESLNLLIKRIEEFFIEDKSSFVSKSQSTIGKEPIKAEIKKVMGYLLDEEK